MFADLNAIAPQTVKAIAEPFLAEGLPFADGGILGGPPTREGYNPRIYVSGEAADQVARLNDYGLDVRAFSAEVGAASAVKMAFAGCVFVALAVSEKGELIDEPEVDLVGIPEKNVAGELLDDVVFDAVMSTVETLPK